jgi:predicted RNA-binding Zn ribbon-like protein
MNVPPWVQPETKPAPIPLLLVQAFVNTWDVEAGEDSLAELDSAREWLGAAGLIPEAGSLDMAELRRAREVREGFRALLVANGGGPAPTPGELAPLHALTREYRLAASIDPEGNVELIPAGAAEAGGGHDGVAAGLFGLILVMRDAQADGTWPRLKSCRNPDCHWVFYDRSHSRRGAWCDMAVCGNRLKNRALRERRKA